MPESLSHSDITKLLEPFGISASRALSSSISGYISLLLKWNSKMALTTVTDSREIVRFHFGESLFAVSTVPISHGRLADVGSGAGFPGLPLAMLVPDLRVVLIESNLKKATFLAEVIRTLNLKNAAVWRGRMEDLELGEHGFDFVTARALGNYDGLLAWSFESLQRRGKLVLWLGETEAARIGKAPEWTWAPKISIPFSDRRALLVGSRHF